MRNDYDDPDHDTYDPDHEPDGLRWMSVVVVGLVLVGFFSLAWYAYETSQEPQDDGEITLVEADRSPLRERPEDVGGMEFPHQDKEVYNTIVSGNGEKEGVERLMPEPEEPVNVSDAPVEEQPKPVTTQAEEPTEDVKPVTAEEEPKPRPVAVAKPVENKAPEPKPVVKKQQPQPKAEQKPTKPTTPAPTPASSTGRATAQLGALRSSAEAQSLWQKLSAKHADLLAGKTPQIIRADLGAKGVYYRLRVSGVDAGRLCSALTARGQTCMAVK